METKEAAPTAAAPTFVFDEAQAQRYREGPPKFIPGFEVMQRMVVQLVHEKVGGKGHILVLGAGGGLELKTFSDAYADWTFTGVDPSLPMLNQANGFLGEAATRVEWFEGYIADAPEGPYDAATCLLTLHLIPDDGAKLATLKELHRRLKPGAPFVVVDQCIDGKSPKATLMLDRYAQFAMNSGVPQELALKARAAVESMLSESSVAPEREEAVLCEAGFQDLQLFYAGLAWRGWVAYA